MGVLEWIPHKQASQRDSHESHLLAVLPRKVCVGGGGGWESGIGREVGQAGPWPHQRVVSTSAAEPNPN